MKIELPKNWKEIAGLKPVSYGQINEDKISSGKAQHTCDGKDDEKAHAEYMKKTHNVDTKFHHDHMDDELEYIGSKEDVKAALMTHYGDDEEQAKHNHPKIFA